MKVISTNIAKQRVINRKGEKINTGIFKEPVNSPIFLDYYGVRDDNVSDLKVHGGKDKAVYAYSDIAYSFWRNLYPDYYFNWGFFGENLSISNLDESIIHIGDIFKIGSSKVQVSQPRQPCFKLGLKFGNQKIIKKFIDANFPGIYFRVIESGTVSINDKTELLESKNNSFTVKEIFKMLYGKISDKNLIIQASEDTALAVSCKKDLLKKLK